MKRLFKHFVLLLAALMLAVCAFTACTSVTDDGNDDDGNNEPTVTAVSITNKPAGNQLDVGESVTLGYTLTPADAEADVTWSSSDSSKASVDDSGKVTGVAAGSAIITVTVDGTEISDRTAISVVEPVVANPVTDITLSGVADGDTMQRGESKTITVASTPEDCDPYTIDWTYSTDGCVEVVRTVESGVYTLVADGYGTADVTATVSGTDISKTFSVTVEGDIDEVNGIATETFASGRGSIESDGTYYLDNTLASTHNAPIYRGVFFDAGSRINSTSASDLSVVDESLRFTVYSNNTYEKVTFHYLGDIDAEETYIVRIPITCVSVTEDAAFNYRFYYGFFKKASDDNLALSYNRLDTANTEIPVRYRQNISSSVSPYPAFGFSEVGETVYLNIRVLGSDWNGEVFINSRANGGGSTDAAGRITISFDNVQIIKTSEVEQDTAAETFDGADVSGTSGGMSISTDKMAVTTNGDALFVENGLVSGDFGPDTALQPSIGNYLRWGTGRIYDRATMPEGRSQTKMLFTFSDVDPTKAYDIEIPVQGVIAQTWSGSTDATFTLADLNVVIFNKDSGSEQDEVYNGNPFVYNGYNTVIKITIPAGSDWNGVLCFRLYCAKFNDGAADNSAKVSLCFDNISIAEAA